MFKHISLKFSSVFLSLIILIVLNSFIAYAFTTSSLTVSLNLDENTGTTANDKSGNSYNGTVSGSPSWSGGNITFDGTDDKITITDNNALDSATHSYDVWFTMPSSSDWASVSNSFPRLIDKVPSNTLSGTNLMVYQPTRNIRAYFGGSTWSNATVGSVSGNFLISSNTLSYDTKYHIAFTYNDVTRIGKIYVDNVLVASATSGGAYVANTSNVAIGGNPFDNTRNIKGTIHRVSIYGKELSSTEVQDNYTSGSDYNYDVSTYPSASLSTVGASDSSIPGDNLTISTITVTVLNASSSALANKTVSLSSSRGTQDTISPSTVVTDGSGIATFSVKSSNAGTSTYTAVVDTITITDTVDVTYTSGITTVNGITYTSTLDSLSMKMDVSYNPLSTDLPIVLVLHGHTTVVPDGIIQRLANKGVFAIRTYKRSFNSSQGTSDDGGKEVYDFRDAVEYVKNNYSSYVDEENINVIGYSGGGGNAYGLVTRFPDYFNTASIFFGMSDYGYNSTYGWYNNGATAGQKTILESRIGGTPAAAADNYYARAFTLGAKNNPYTYTQLFYDQDETNVPQSHATQYRNNALAEGFTNVVTRFSDADLLTTELNDDLSTNLSEWNSNGAGATDIVWNSSEQYVDWTTDRNATFDSLYKKFDSLRNLSKSNRFKATFTFKVNSSADNNSLTMIGFKNSGDIALRNTAVLVLNNVSGTVKPYVRIDYNGTPLNSSNRTLQIFSSSITLGQTYNFELEVYAGTLIGTLKDASLNTIESQSISFDSSKTFDGVDSFGIANFNGDNGSLLQTGTLDNITVSSWARWYHGYPEEGASGEHNISAENYIIPVITAGTYGQPTLNTSDEMFIPGYLRTDNFQFLLGTGANEAANLTYNISGNANSNSSAKTFTVEGLTGYSAVDLTLYGLQANTEYNVIEDNLTDTTTAASATTNGSGLLNHTDSLSGTKQYRVYIDNDAPSASSISTSNVSSTGGNITWNTNEATSSKVDYGLTTSYGNSTSEQNTYTRVTSHSISLSGLKECSIYQYRVRSKDTAENEVISDNKSFLTSGCEGSASIESNNTGNISNSSGGSLSLIEDGKGLTLNALSGYGSSALNFQIKRLNKNAVLDSISTPNDLYLVGNLIYDLKALSGLNTLVSNFNNNITVTINYSSDTDESDLKMYRWNGSTWNLLTGCTQDKTSNNMSCPTNEFSIFGLFNNDSGNSEEICTDDIGIQPSWLYSAVALDSKSIKLQFTEADDPIDHYSIKYGLASDNYNESKEDIGIKSQSKMEYVVKNLAPNSTYYFRVRGNNGCKFGEWSNEIKATTKPNILFNTLTFTDTKLESAIEPKEETISPEVTKDETSNSQTEQEGYKVKVKVLNEENKPVEGAKVTMHSKVQEATTDKDGLAFFENVEKGDHRVIIAYNGFEGEQALNLTGDVKEFSLEIKVKEQSVVTSPLYLWSMGIAGVAIVFLVILFAKKK